jgi:hypothetical protein
MGCIASINIEFTPVDNAERVMYDEFMNMGFTPENINELYAFFVSMDQDMSQQISLKEFLNTVKIEPSPFINVVFAVMDLDGSGELNFLEFVCSLWNLLSSDVRTLGSFIYLLIPKDAANNKSNSVRIEQAKSMLKSIHSTSSAAIDGMIRDFAASMESASCSREDLELYVYEHQTIINPFVNSQLRLKERLLGHAEWTRLQVHRQRVPALRAYTYPYLLRSKVEALTLDMTNRKKMESDVSRAKLKHTAEKSGRKKSVILAFMGIDPIKNAKKAVSDKKRTPNTAGAGEGYADSSEQKFEANKASYDAAQKKNAVIYKSLNANGNAQRPKSASGKNYRGAPVSITKTN